MNELFADSLMARLMAEPWWLQAWVGWMMLVNTASLFFLRHREARWVLAVWVGNVITMMALYEAVGYVRLLGLSHVLWWTPLLVYLVAVRERFAGNGVFGLWARGPTGHDRDLACDRLHRRRSLPHGRRCARRLISKRNRYLWVRRTVDVASDAVPATFVAAGTAWSQVRL